MCNASNDSDYLLLELQQVVEYSRGNFQLSLVLKRLKKNDDIKTYMQEEK
jgi:hypothetical protein